MSFLICFGFCWHFCWPLLVWIKNTNSTTFFGHLAFKLELFWCSGYSCFTRSKTTTTRTFKNLKKLILKNWAFLRAVVCPPLSTPRSQSYDFRIYDYNASVVVHRLERFFKVEENIFVFKTHSWCCVFLQRWRWNVGLVPGLNQHLEIRYLNFKSVQDFDALAAWRIGHNVRLRSWRSGFRSRQATCMSYGLGEFDVGNMERFLWLNHDILWLRLHAHPKAVNANFHSNA
jgi:hypothetical protein